MGYGLHITKSSLSDYQLHNDIPPKIGDFLLLKQGYQVEIINP